MSPGFLFSKVGLVLPTTIMATIRHCQKPSNQQRVKRYICSLLAVFIITIPQTGTAWGSQERSLDHVSKLVTNGGYLVKSEHKTIGYRAKDIFLPASTLKILTSLAAFELLGSQFRFETHFFLDKKQNLYIKGYGDPFLTSEEILRICSFLKNRGVNKIHTVFLDDSSFALQQPTPGTDNSNNPYDAPNGALAVNFNTLAINKLPDGTIQSAEVQTPTLPIMKRLGRDLPTGIQRINIERPTTENRFPISLQYAGELFCAQMRQTGITVTNDFQIQRVPHSLRPLWIYKNSKTLHDVMGECLQYSNNFIANQVFLYCGLRAHGAPANWSKARSFMNTYLKNTLKLSPQQISVQDGSGLSRENKISAGALITVLERFKPYSRLLNQHPGTLLKSGTLQGVYCYGGYFTEDASLTPFAILLNQQKNSRDELLRRLRALYNSPE